MIKAHSLLYAIYICLLVSILCGALLFFSNIYSQLNLHYNILEELYLQNHSSTNYALSSEENSLVLSDDDTNIINECTKKKFGLLTILNTTTTFKNDTISSTYLIGQYLNDKTALYVPKFFSKDLSFSGNVKITGNCYLPSKQIETAYILNEPNKLKINGDKLISDNFLPKLNPKSTLTINEINLVEPKLSLNQIEKGNNETYFNSFKLPTRVINISTVIDNIKIKGNFILKNKDSIRITKNNLIEDIIVIAPKITIEEGFKGNLQLFTNEEINIEPNVSLQYPSLICLKAENSNSSKIRIKEKVNIYGSIILTNDNKEITNQNSIEIGEKGSILGDIYCNGQLDLKSKTTGSVYTNRVFCKTVSSEYNNLLRNLDIDATGKPSYYLSIPLFETSKGNHYGIIKKVR